MYLIAIIPVCIIHCIKKEPLTQVIGYHPFLEKMDPPPISTTFVATCLTTLFMASLVNQINKGLIVKKFVSLFEKSLFL